MLLNTSSFSLENTCASESLMDLSVQYLEDEVGQSKAEHEPRPSKKGDYQNHVLHFHTLSKYRLTRTSY